MDIFEEVNEEVRQEKILAFWKKWSPYIAATVVGVLFVSLVYIGWDYYRAQARSQLAHKYTKALMLGSEGRLDESQKLLQELQNKSGSQYGTLARLSEALVAIKESREQDAVRIYNDVSKDKSVESSLRNFAALQSAKYLLKEGKLDESKMILSALTKLGNEGNAAWRPMAMELEGILLMKQGKPEEAYKVFYNLSFSKTISPNMQNRVTIMKSYLNAGGRFSQPNKK